MPNKITALHRAAAELKEEMQKHCVSVNLDLRMVRYGLDSFILPDYASKNQCLRAIRKFIRQDTFLQKVDTEIKRAKKQNQLL